MQILNFKLTFLTPAFLGDAAQNGRWRTPPIKHELRAWWRVAYAASKQFNFAASEMRKAEALLFGHAWLENDLNERGQTVAARKSLVRLRLAHWQEGQLKQAQWPRDITVQHPEVRRNGQITPVGSSLYLGYGPLEHRGGTALKNNAAIQAGEASKLSLALPQDRLPLIDKALALMDRYGTLGGRSRNGWGSYALDPMDGTPAHSVDPLPLRRWQDALDLDWPHAIGKDEKGALIWRTEPQNDWQSLMKTLASLKIGLRTQFVFLNPPGTLEDRHWLSYPVGTHPVSGWKNLGLRLPNQLRFKVRKTNDGRLVGVIFHMPHLPPPAFSPNRRVIESVWQKVHRFLDGQGQKLSRISA
ncbi:MAG: hypothetical protein N3F11_08245 [Casimicrobiaceae bacterium]|nr:hypothetical protein [Casimicrobiaceae bacterium]